MVLIDDSSYREIAAERGCPIGAAMSRISRGRKMLRGVWRERADRRCCHSPPGISNWLYGRPCPDRNCNVYFRAGAFG